MDNDRFSRAILTYRNTPDISTQEEELLCKELGEQGNLGPSGSLDNDRFSRAILTYRNTPDRDTGHSPAQGIFGRV